MSAHEAHHPFSETWSSVVAVLSSVLGYEWANDGRIRRTRIARWIAVVSFHLVIFYILGSVAVALWRD